MSVDWKTHAVAMLRRGPMSGRDLRAWLSDLGRIRTVPFYRMMVELEDEGLVRGYWIQSNIGCKQRWYMVK